MVRMKIGMFGGSFNPIHIGHIQLANAFTENLALDKLLIIPTCVSPHKISNNMASAEQRLEMCRIAFKNNPNFEVSDIEIQRGGTSYTYLTIQKISEIYKNDELFLITGADMFMSIHTWKHPEIIFSLAVICTVPRNNDNIENLEKQSEYLKTLGAKTKLLDINVITVSSTEIRGKIKNGESTDGLIPIEVREYINKNGLFGSVL